MRKNKIIKINEREITVKELRVKDIIELFQTEGKEGGFDFQRFIVDIVPKCTDLKADEVIEFAPSEIKLVYDAFKEVNSVFFDIARQIGLDKILDTVKERISKTFSAQYADLLNEGMGKPV